MMASDGPFGENAKVPTSTRGQSLGTVPSRTDIRSNTTVKSMIKQQESSTPSRSTARISLIVGSLALVVFLASLDATIVATALPSIAQDLNLPSSSYAWISSSYLLGTVAAMAIWAKLSDVFGRKPIILTSNAFFLLGSLISALAQGIAQLIAGRVIQGFGSGGLLVLSNVCLSDLFSLRERGFYMSILSTVWALSSSLGPIFGGAMAQNSTWRWVFWLNLPVDGLCLAGLAIFLDVHNPRTPLVAGIRAIDWLGIVLLGGSTTMFLLGLNFGSSTSGWSATSSICLIVFGVFTFFLLLLQQKFNTVPLFPSRVFKGWSNFSIFTICFLHGMAYISIIYYLPLYFQAVLSASPLQSGVWLLALALPVAIVAIAIGLTIRKTGFYVKHFIVVGLAVMTLAAGLFIDFPSYRSWSRLIIFQILAGAGMAPVFQVPIVVLQQTLKPQDIAVSVSAFQITRQIGSTMGLILGQVVLQSRLHIALRSINFSNPPAALLQGSPTAAIQYLNRLGLAQQDSLRTILSNAFSDMWIFFACICFVALLFSFLVRSQKLSDRHVEHKPGIGDPGRSDT